VASHGIDRTGAAGGSGTASLIGAFAELADPDADAFVFWDDSAGGFDWFAATGGGVVVSDGSSYALQSGATFRTTVGLGTGDSPQFTAVEVGHASDTTLARAAAGRLSVEGVAVVRGPASATDNAIARFDAATGDLIQNSGVTVDDSDNLDVPGTLTAVGYSRRNAIINGDFSVWQRGTSAAGVSGTGYVADRWEYSETGDTVVTISRSTDVPTVAEAGRLFNYSHLIDVTTVDAAIAAGDFVIIQQKIEGYNWVPLAQRIITLSFWVKATKAGIYCVAIRNSGVDRSCVKEYTVNTSDTWEKKIVTFPASPSAGTWDYTSGIGAYVTFALAAGSTFQGTADSYQSSNIFATANQVNGVDSNSNDFRITGVQLEAGGAATAFEHRSVQDELILCQRYYQKSYNVATAVGTVTDSGARVARVNVAGQTGIEALQTDLIPVMRGTPTVTWYSSASGSANTVFDVTAAADRAVATNSGNSDRTTGFPNLSVGITGADTFARAQFIASTEL
jgi:hypothetical protein